MTNIVLIALAIIIVSLLGFVIWSFWRRSDREAEPIQPPEETSPSQKEIHDSPETSVSSEVKVEDEQQLPPKESEDLLVTEEQDPADLTPINVPPLELEFYPF